MAVPLSGLTFARMPDANPSGTAVNNLLDAIFNTLSGTTDYRGTALDSAHTWTVSRFQSLGTTEAVYLTAPAGTAMTKSPAIIIAGTGTVGSGTMATPDTFTASIIQVGINKNSGAFLNWGFTSPFTSGNFSGYWRAVSATTINATGSIVRSFISQDSLFVQLVQPTTTSQHWFYVGAILEPYTSDTTLDAETDNRLYGMMVSGGSAVVNSAWSNSAAQVFSHSTAANTYHGLVFTPGAGTIINVGHRISAANAASVASLTTLAGTYVGTLLEMGKSVATNDNSGARMGTLRGIYFAGTVQSGRYLRNGSTDLYHFISTDTAAAADGLMIPAVS